MTHADPAVQRLLDEADLRALSATYMRGLDRLDESLVRSVFADDATTHYESFVGGADDMPPMAIRALSTYRTTQHRLGQINLVIDGDTATGEVYFQAFHQHATDDFDRFICGRYEYFSLRPQTVRGVRDHSDLSYRPNEA